MWKKLGLIFEPPRKGWMMSHAQNPFCEPLDDKGLYRVHFASRDEKNRSRGGTFDFDVRRPEKTLAVSEKPTLDLGELGAFDDSGVMPSTLVDFKGRRHLYYTGWQKAVDVPFLFFIGLAVSEDGGVNYRRASRAPVLGRNARDPFMTGAPWVIREGDLLRMWYISATKWELDPANPSAKPKHYYTIKHADSKDGLTWNTSERLCINYEEGEYAIARPTVIKKDGIYQMRFTYRGGIDTYRIGLAESKDGVSWHRKRDDLELETSPSGWDSQMVCYGSVFFRGQTMYMLYNGNNYGETGVGLAVWSAAQRS